MGALDRERETAVRIRSSLKVAERLGIKLDGAPCPYVRHRGTDWRRPGGPLTCGICHPPAPGVPIGEPR